MPESNTSSRPVITSQEWEQWRSFPATLKIVQTLEHEIEQARSQFEGLDYNTEISRAQELKVEIQVKRRIIQFVNQPSAPQSEVDGEDVPTNTSF